MSNLIDLTGQQFGSLVVLRRYEKKTRPVRWVVQCACGTLKDVSGSELRRGSTKTCGCRVRARGVDAANYKGWGEMSATFWRRVESNARSRGIAVEVTPEEAWQLFLDQDKRCALTGEELSIFSGESNKGTHTASLDRIDSDKPYRLENVQWVHKNVNLAKQRLSQDEFISLCQAVVRHTEARKG